MINLNYTSNLYQPNFYLHRDRGKFDSVFMKHNTVRMIKNVWSGDLAYWRDGSTFRQSTQSITPLAARRYKWSGKVTRIKELVISGKYKVDAEKLAEKLLGSMVGVLLPS